MQELVQQWEEVYPDSFAEAELMGREKGIEQGIEQGLEQGIEQGLEQGIEQGLEQGIEQGLEQGIEQGARQTQMAIAERMVRAGRPDQEIEQFTNITPEQIAQLRL